MTNLDHDKYTKVAQHIIRRHARRGVQVLGRQEDKHPALKDFAKTFVPLALEYIAAYDGHRTIGTEQAREKREADRAVRQLDQRVQTWSARLTHDLYGFEVKSFTNKRQIADDIIDNATRLIELVTKHEAKGINLLAYANELIAELTALRDVADKEWSELQELLSANQERAAMVRALATRMQAALVTLRRLLRTVLGRSHRDYQKLRLPAASRLDDEDDEVRHGVGQVGDEVVPIAGGTEATEVEAAE